MALNLQGCAGPHQILPTAPTLPNPGGAAGRACSFGPAGKGITSGPTVTRWALSPAGGSGDTVSNTLQVGGFQGHSSQREMSRGKPQA